MNNADYGLTLQKLICDEYQISVNEWAKAQFDASYNREYIKELKPIVPIIFEKAKSEPKILLK